MTSLERLGCSACGGPVPLTTAEVTPCPSCQAQVTMPEAYRAARRDTELAVANEAAAQRWLDRAGRGPSPLLAPFTFLDSGAFWSVVFPVLIPIGVALSTLLLPRFIESVWHVRIVDVWADTTVAATTIGLPFVVLLLGLLLGGFGRKRSLSRAGLQAALAARPTINCERRVELSLVCSAARHR